jgi:hypothetical protein
MSRLAPPAHRSSILALVLLAATAGAASVGHTQQVAGSIGVSLTILQPTVVAPPRVTGFEVRDGIARIETTLPAPARTSQLVMSRIASSASAYTPEAERPTLVMPSSGVIRMRHRVSLPRDRRADRAPPTALRVEYLIFAGT